MSGLYEHSDYQAALDYFNNSRCSWNKFTSVQMKVSKNKCPICECALDDPISRLTSKGKISYLTATVDHYRPKKFYRFLKCTHQNYLLMCSECNNIYKGYEFPLYNSTDRAKSYEEIQSEQALIVNPIHDDLLALFILVFKRSGRGKNILELKPKPHISTGYLYEKAVETIKLFGLGDCDVNRHPNDNIYHCRIEVLESHFGLFYQFAKSLKIGDRRTAMLELEAYGDIFKRYGFFDFLKHPDNFEVNI